MPRKTDLAARRDKNLRDRRSLAAFRQHRTRRKSDRTRNDALTFLASLPTDKLLAVYRAAARHFKAP